MFLGVDSPFFSTIVLFKNWLFPPPRASDGFLKRRIPGKNGEGTPRILGGMFLRFFWVGTPFLVVWETNSTNKTHFGRVRVPQKGRSTTRSACGPASVLTPCFATSSKLKPPPERRSRRTTGLSPDPFQNKPRETIKPPQVSRERLLGDKMWQRRPKRTNDCLTKGQAQKV